MWKQYSHCSLACQLRSDKFFGTSCLVRVKCIHRLAARRLTALLTPASVVGLSLLLVVDEPGEIAEVVLAGTEPLENVPRSVVEHGHTVLVLSPVASVKGSNAVHRLVIRKEKA